MAGDKFTLEIFADTKAAEAALKRFAGQQKALAADLARSTPQQAQSLIAPKVTPAFQQGGQLSAQLAGSVQAGNITQAEADALKAKYIKSSNELVRAQLREVAGLDASAAARVQTTAAMEGFKQAQSILTAATRERAKTEAAASASTKKNAQREAAASAEVTAAKKTLYPPTPRTASGAVRQPYVPGAIPLGAAYETPEQRAVRLGRNRAAAGVAVAADPKVEELKVEQARLLAIRNAQIREAIALDAEVQAARTAELQAKRLSARQSQTEVARNPATVSAETELLLAKRELAATTRARADQDIRTIAANRAAEANASPFQRIYGRITGNPVQQAPTGGQFFGRKLATTAGYGFTSIALFGALAGIGKSVKEAEELDRAMNDIAFQLQSFGKGNQVEEVRGQILGIARDTGLAADEVARVAFQLQGAFGGDIVRSMRETAAAAEFVRITGLSLEETVDSFTALTQSFNDGSLSARTFGDTAFGLQERFGVLAKEILVFASDLAPVAEAAGFTVQELEALGAAAQKFSGRSGSSLAEAFGRIIPQIQGNATEFIGLFSQTPNLRGFADEITAAFGSGDIQRVFEILIQSYSEMSRTQQGFVVDLLGGRREAAALIPVLENGNEVLQEWSGTFNDAGKQSERFSAFNKTLQQQLTVLGEKFSQLGVQIFESGFKDLLEFILASGTGVVGVVSQIASVFSGLNESLGGIPGQLLAIVAALKLLQAASNTALAGRLLGGGLGGALAARGPAVAAGGVPLGLQGLFATGGAAGFGTLSGRAPVGFSTPAVPLLQQLRGTPSAPLTTLSGRAAINERSSIQAIREQSGRFWSRTTTGIRQGFENNKGLIGASALLLGTQLLTEFSDGITQAERQRGAESISGLGERLARGEALTAAERSRLEASARTGPNLGIEIQNAISAVPIVGQGIAGLANAVTGGAGQAEQGAAEEARRVMVAQTQEVLVAQADALREAGLLGTEEGIRLFGDGQDIPTEEISRIIDKAAAGETLNAREFQVYEALRAIIPDAITQNVKVAEAIQGTQAEQNYGTATQTLEAVTSRYEAGAASRGEYLTALATAAAGARRLIAEGTANEESLADALEDVQRFRQIVSESLLAGIEAASQLRSFTTGREDPQALAADLLAAIRGGQLTPEDQRQAINDFFAAQQAILQLRADAADSVAEANRILRRGIAVPQDIRIASILDQLEQNTDFAVFSEGMNDALEETIGDTNRFNRQTARLMVLQGITAREARNIVIQGLIEDYRRILASAPSGLDAQGAQRAIALLEDELRRISSRQGDRLTGVEVQDPNRIRGEAQSQADAAADRQERAAAIAEAQFTLLESLTEDPLELARIAIARAEAALARAKGPAEIRQAQADLNNAQRGLRDAIRDIYDSQFELLESTTEDPVKLAKFALQRALEDLRRARQAGDDAAINRALAAVNNARRGVRDALQEVMDAQTSLLIAIADAAGNTVRSAQLALQQAQRDLRRLRDQDAGTAAIRNARAQVVASQAGVRDALLQRRQDHYQFLYDMGRITTGQLVSYLQSLLSIPDLTRQQIRDIQLQIRNLRQELGQDFQFNLPTELALPTLFEVRRADQSGGRNFTDQRQVTVNVNVSSNVDLAALESVLASSVGQNVNGTIPRRY